MIELISLKELMLLRQLCQKSATFVTTGIQEFNFQPYACMPATNLSNIAILSINDVLKNRGQNLNAKYRKND